MLFGKFSITKKFYSILLEANEDLYYHNYITELFLLSDSSQEHKYHKLIPLNIDTRLL